MKKIICILFFIPQMLAAQNVNYDEARIPAYTLPDILTGIDNKKITSAAQWEANRPALVRLFAENVYGITPEIKSRVKYKIIETNNNALGGKAIRKQVLITFEDFPQLNGINLLLYIPKHIRKPSVFIGLNFEGNHSLGNDPDVLITQNWMVDFQKNPEHIFKNRATLASRGKAVVETWPAETIISKGFAMATAYYGDIEPDHAEGWKAGLRGCLNKTEETEWSAMGAWAWQLSRMLDYLETDNDVNSKKAIVIGHSRLGKAAFWAAAQDQRFAAFISNESGEGGAALKRRWYGETHEIINKNFPHWFSGKYKTYAGSIDALPFDQHQLFGLIAPRAVYVSSAEGDQWADPNGEFLALKNAEPVFALYGKNGLGVDAQPKVDNPVGSDIRYHYRSGKHHMTAYDWEQYLKFAAEVVNKRK
ncbi:acetylxylan esterase [Emticicia sp. TH156]|uniref:glucuronyl esterase domain-containing protein n=1 Tax=Emticicia sp. TH156 TaxID=2067454 RepID=UPI000C7784E9|nr:acetylxylan esterase [Emticicia sp. TH156]PLK45381.1 acetylxylan esterase [Emticicia sp. TH156]